MEEFELKGLQCKATPYFGDGEGGAGVLLAVSGSLMGEWLTSVCAVIQALSHPISMRIYMKTGQWRHFWSFGLEVQRYLSLWSAYSAGMTRSWCLGGLDEDCQRWYVETLRKQENNVLLCIPWSCLLALICKRQRVTWVARFITSVCRFTWFLIFCKFARKFWLLRIIIDLLSKVLPLMWCYR